MTNMKTQSDLITERERINQRLAEINEKRLPLNENLNKLSIDISNYNSVEGRYNINYEEFQKYQNHLNILTGIKNQEDLIKEINRITEILTKIEKDLYSKILTTC